GDVAHLAGEVVRELVDVVGQILPRSGDAAHLGLSAELAFRADLARDARHFRGEAVELVDHRVDGVLELEDFAFDVDGDLLRQVPERDRGGHFGDVADLTGEVRGEVVHIVGQVLPGSANALDLGLTAELAFRADFAGHARHFRGEGIQLIDHDVDGVLQLEDFAFHLDRDLLGQVALGDGGGHLGDVADLAGQITGHEVYIVGQVGPGAGDAFDAGLAAELALGADFARHASDFRSEGVQLVDHRVDGVLEGEDFALHVDRDLLRQIALGDGGGHFGDVADLDGEARRHQVDAVREIR